MPEHEHLAIAHDYLTQRGGAERVVLALHRMFPQAPIYTTFYDPDGTFDEFREAHIITSPLNRVSFLRRDPRRALPLLPLISSAIRVREPLAVVSSSGWAHGFRCAGAALIYCHTPARWLYLTEQYLGHRWWRSARGIAVTALSPALRAWDRAAQRRGERYVGNSTVVRERIRAVYGGAGQNADGDHDGGHDSDTDDVGLIFPPHAVDIDGPQTPVPGAEHLADTGYLLVVSRLMPYKNVDAVIDAARAGGHHLLIIGRGPQEQALRERAGAELGRRIVFAEDLEESQLRWAYAHARMLLALSHEDFGITPVEASAWGVPTVALRAGGYLDTIDERINGVFVDTPRAEDIAVGIEAAEARRWDPAAIRAHAQSFSEERFAQQIRAELAALTQPRPQPG